MTHIHFPRMSIDTARLIVAANENRIVAMRVREYHMADSANKQPLLGQPNRKLEIIAFCVGFVMVLAVWWLK